MRNKAIFWDFDGTLVHSNSLWSSSVFKAIGGDSNRYGITFAGVRPYMKMGFPWHEHERDLRHLTDGTWWDYMFSFITSVYLKLGVEKEEAGQAARKVRGYILDSANYVVYDDAFSTLEKCAALGYKNYILSNNYPELEEIVEKLGFSPYFDGIIVSGKIGYDKPRKELFDYALNLAGNPDIAYMIGDNPFADVEGANRSGMISVLVHCEDSGNERYKIESLGELLGIVQ